MHFQIALQELIAVVMLVATFGEELRGCELSLYIDSDAVLGALLKGGCRAEDANLIIGRVWLWFAQEQIAIEIWRVESKANVYCTRKTFLLQFYKNGRYILISGLQR